VATEKELLDVISTIFTASKNESVLVGIGDDAAVIKASLTPIALAADMAVEGTHFSRHWSSLYEIGAKISSANLADIFAMGGNPEFLLVSAALPSGISVEEVQELALGIADEATSVGANIVGGDLTFSEKIVISISVFGSVAKPIQRSGALVGDDVVISKITGESAAGLDLLRRGILDGNSAEHRNPTVNYQSAQAISAIAHSMIDVSDGLVSELVHIATAAHVGIAIPREALEAAPGFAHLKLLANEHGSDVWQWILHGGEDHAFVATVAAGSKLPAGFTRIGSVIDGSRVHVDGFIVEHQGYEHFAL
jgi:thiamine-monophosphate kinase